MQLNLELQTDVDIKTNKLLCVQWIIASILADKQKNNNLVFACQKYFQRGITKGGALHMSQY